jgi:hypothetical protein
VPAEETLGVEADLRIGVTRHLKVNIEGNRSELSVLFGR